MGQESLLPSQLPHISFNLENLLIVEGKDEENFFSCLLKDLGLNNIQIINLGGKDNYRAGILQLNKALGYPKLKSILITRDLDSQDPNDAYKSISRLLNQINLLPPTSLNSFGLGSPKTGIFLLPDNKSPGALENLFIKSIQDSNLFKCVEDYIECNKNFLTLSPKAITQIYLASCEPLTSSLGMASMKHIIDFNKPAFQQLRQFLSDFFS